MSSTRDKPIIPTSDSTSRKIGQFGYPEHYNREAQVDSGRALELGEVHLHKEFKAASSERAEYIDISADIGRKPQQFQSRVFLLFTLVNLFTNYDTGVIPAALLQIQSEIGLDHKKIAITGT